MILNIPFQKVFFFRFGFPNPFYCVMLYSISMVKMARFDILLVWRLWIFIRLFSIFSFRTERIAENFLIRWTDIPQWRQPTSKSPSRKRKRPKPRRYNFQYGSSGKERALAKESFVPSINFWQPIRFPSDMHYFPWFLDWSWLKNFNLASISLVEYAGFCGFGDWC